ncbi:streptophobe family protein [Streptomyces sp. NPDC087300]|uniref:streptophobe family protein n=1 Tax=Streptomyces sp. NPDC087300 TaxID=3365780 RepID=UPI00381AAD09
MQTDEYRSESRGVRWGDVLLSAIAAVSWALVGMAGTAALGLHLLGADEVGSLGPMTAATVALGAGGSVTPSGDVSAFGLKGAEATTAIDIAPLGVGLVGALLLSLFFLRSLRGAGAVVAPGELAARLGAVIALFLAMLAGLAWAGHDIITIDGERLGIDKGLDKGLDKLPGGIGDKLPGGIGGLLPDRLGDLAKAKAAVGFTVDTAPTLLGGAVWVAGVLLVALLASRRSPLPRGLDALHRVVRPAVSALVAVVVVAVLAGLAAAVYAMVGDDHPKRIAGAALLGAPNGVWLGVPVGLFVPWDGKATGALTQFLPDPVDDLLTGPSDKALTLGRLAELDGRVWLLGVAAALMMLFAGVLTAVRTPWERRVSGQEASVRGSSAREASGPDAAGRHASVREVGALGFAARCGVRLGVVTALGLPLLVWLTGVSADASLSVFGFDAFGAGIELHGRLGPAVLLGAAWGFGAGVAGALLAVASGAAGGSVAPLARAGHEVPAGAGHGAASGADYASAYDSNSGSGSGSGSAVPAEAGPYQPGAPHRPPNPDTNPYLKQLPRKGAAPPPDDSSARPPRDVSGAPTVVGPVGPPPSPPPRPKSRSADWPPPPPPPPPPPEPGPPGPGKPRRPR